MRVQEAVRRRILDLAEEKQISINHLAESSGVAGSTLRLTVAPYATVQNTGIVTIQRLCQGLGIELPDFFNCDYFRHLEPEEEK